MRSSGNDLLQKKIALKEQKTILLKINDNIIPPFPTTSHREQKISDPPLFAGDRSKAQAWIIEMRLKLAADARFFRTEQAKMVYNLTF